MTEGVPCRHRRALRAAPAGRILNCRPGLVDGLRDQLSLWPRVPARYGHPPGPELSTSSQRAIRQITTGLDDLGLTWIEIDLYDPVGLAGIRERVANAHRLLRVAVRPARVPAVLREGRMDVAIIDLPWNGAWLGMKIAAMAEAYEINCAPHNFYGHLSSLMSAHFCAALPNFRVMEIDIDDVPWKRRHHHLGSRHPRRLRSRLPPGPGWGAKLNEDVIAEHPPKFVKAD